MVALSMMLANHASTTITLYWPLGWANSYRKVETTKLLLISALIQHCKQRSMLHVTLVRSGKICTFLTLTKQENNAKQKYM